MSPANAQIPEANRDRESEHAQQSEIAPVEYSGGEAERQIQILAGVGILARGGSKGMQENASAIRVQCRGEFEAKV